MLLAMPIPVVWSPETRRHEPMREVWVGRADRGHRAPRAGRPDPRGPERPRPRRGDAPRRRRAARVHDPAYVDHLRTIHAEWSDGPVRRAGRAGPGRALRLPDAGDDAGHAADPGRGDARPRGGVRLRHDDARRPRHLGGGPRGGRLRADRRRPRRRGGGRDRGVRALPAAGPPRHPRRATAAPATSTTPPSPPRRSATPGTRPSRWSTSTPTTATAPRRSSGTAPTSSTARPTSTRRRAGSPTTSATPTRPAPVTGEGATLNLPLAEGTGRRALARRRSADWPSCAAGPTPSSSRSASTRPPTTPRARCSSPPTGYAAAGRLLGSLGLPCVVVQEGGYHLPSLGGLVAAYLDGHSAPADGSDPRVLGGC